MQPIIDAMPEGADKEKLLALVESQDAVERPDVHPKDRARALRRLLQLDAARASGEGSPPKAPGKTA